MTTRREALKIIGAVGVTCSFPFSANELYGQHVHPAMQADPEDSKPGAPFQPQFFTPAQLLIVSRLADLIIPATDTPGAAGAGVPQYIDLVVHGDPKLQATFKAGLESLDRTSQTKFGSVFLGLTETRQVEILTSLNEDSEAKKPPTENAPEGDVSFFHAIKGLTADGYYTSRIGLMQELGYNGDAVLAAFPVFTIPEH
jgi:gluconate 2-dehydrogenase gamma chain